MNLLYPKGKEHTTKLADDTCQNLAFDELIEMISVLDVEKELVKNVLSVIPGDDETIFYRQEILRDFIEHEEFCNQLKEILKSLDVLKQYRENNHFRLGDKSTIWQLIDYMQEMDAYVQIIEGLNELFMQYEMQSAGMKEIAGLLKKVIDMDRIEELKEIVNNLRAEVAYVKSVTVGINLTPELQPQEVILLEYNKQPFRSRLTKTQVTLSINMGRRITYKKDDPFMPLLCKEMENKLSKSVQQYKKELKNYVNFEGYFLLDICDDLKFYLLMAQFGRSLKEQGHTICYPKVDSVSKSVAIKGLYNLRLTTKGLNAIIKNDFEFSQKEKIFILTGPNRGGKTILTQAVGIAAILAAQGMFVAADSYEGFAFHNVLTHFPADENATIDMGRLGEEAVRIQKIVKQADNRTLTLFNETYSSTSALDGLYLAKDLVHILKHKGVPTIYNTHLHELAHMTQEMNQWDGEGDVVSLTMEIVDNVNTYRVLRKEPDSSSFAKNIAFRYGVTYEQMLSE